MKEVESLAVYRRTDTVHEGCAGVIWVDVWMLGGLTRSAGDHQIRCRACARGCVVGVSIQGENIESEGRVVES